MKFLFSPQEDCFSSLCIYNPVGKSIIQFALQITELGVKYKTNQINKIKDVTTKRSLPLCLGQNKDYEDFIHQNNFNETPT